MLRLGQLAGRIIVTWSEWLCEELKLRVVRLPLINITANLACVKRYLVRRAQRTVIVAARANWPSICYIMD